MLLDYKRGIYLVGRTTNGYERIQNAGKVMLSSLGITEMEFSNLQMDLQRNGRENWENFVANKLRNIPSKMYRNGFEEALDCIWNSGNKKKQRKNLIAQIDSLQRLSKKLFEERFENINPNSEDGLRDLARLRIDEGDRNQALMSLFDEFHINLSELQIDDSESIDTKLSEQGYRDNFFLKLYNIEVEERLKRQEEESRKVYDNKEFIENIYQSFLKYPVKNIPFKDRIGVRFSKLIGIIKRKSLNKNIEFLEEGKTHTNSHSEFVSEMADLGQYETNIQDKTQKYKSGKVKEGNNSENIR